MQSPLLRRLSEIVVVIGADSDTKYKCSSLDEDRLYVEFQPSVLATITESKAVYPNIYPNVNFDYPPKWLSGKSTVPTYMRQHTLPSYEDANIDALVVNNATTTKTRLKDAWIRTVEQSISGDINKRHKSVKKKSRAGLTGFEPRVTYETIEGLPSYCFSRYILLSQIPETSRVVYVPLTDIKGGRLYAVGITYSRYFEDINITCENDSFSTTRKQSGYLPCIVFIICQQPYFNTCRDILSAFHRTIFEDSDFYAAVEELAAIVTNIPALKSNDTILEFNAFGARFRIWPQFSDFDQIIDFDLMILFQLLNVDDIINLVISLLLQRRIVFMSHLSTLSALCCESLLILISPFKWKFTYVPYLPQKLYDLLDAPGPFMYGCESSNIDLSEYSKDITVVDLDAGRVKYPPQNLPLPRSSAINNLKSALNFPMLSFEQYNLGFVEEREFEKYKDRKHFYYSRITKHILTSFMDFMVHSFRDVLLYIKNQENKPPFFNSDNFLKSQKESKQFYNSFVKTELFDSFLHERFRNKSDAWTRFEEKTRMHSLLSRMHNSSFSNSHSFVNSESSMSKRSANSNRNSLILEEFSENSENSGQLTFKLPSFINARSGFIERLIDQATKVANDPNSPQGLKGSTLKLLIDLKQAVGKKEEAIEHIYKLSKLDIRFVDQADVIKILSGLSPVEEMKCKSIPFYEAVKEIVHFEDLRPSDELPTRIQKQITTPSAPIIIDEFLTLVDNAGITSNMRVQEQLFEALSMDHKSKNQFRQVSPDNFNTFYKAWTNIGMTDIDPDIDSSEFKEDEIILKLTREPIRIDPIGYGHLLLTQERLLGIISGSLKPLTKLIDIVSINDTDYWTKGFGRYKSIKVTSKKAIDDDTPGIFTLGLKQDSDTWKCILLEMTCGQRVARQTKDDSYVGVAIDECFILDTIWSCQEESSYFNKYLCDIIKCLSAFTFGHQSSEYILDTYTRKALKRKFQPALLTHLESVESLIFVPCDCKKKGSELWCAVTSQRSSKIIIFDALTLELLGYVSQLQDKKAMCLIYVPLDRTVWVGCQDNVIYIVKVADKTVVQHLLGHRDLILSFAIHPSKCLIGSGSSLGMVIVWDIIERNKKQTWLLENKCGINEMHFYHDYLFCCSRTGLYAFNQNGILIKSFKYSDVDDHDGPQQPDTSTSFSSNNPSMECFRIDNDFLYVGMSRPSIFLIYTLSPFSLTESHCVVTYRVSERCSSVPPCKKCPQDTRCSSCEASEKCRGINRLLVNHKIIWLCCKNGNIFIYDLHEGGVTQRLIAHRNAAILTICKDPFSGNIFTGGRTPDSKIAVWDSVVVGKDFTPPASFTTMESSCSSTMSSTPPASALGPPPSPPPRTKLLTNATFYDFK